MDGDQLTMISYALTCLSVQTQKYKMILYNCKVYEIF